MSSRLRAVFTKTRHESRTALITYFCAGDPALDLSASMIVAAAHGGADIIEVGVPFSDPTADGPSIQRASERALKASTTLSSVLQSIEEARAQTDVPIVLFGYCNPLLSYGFEAALQRAKELRIDGFLIVDLPPEEADELKPLLVAAGVDWIPLIAPTTSQARAQQIAKSATGFVYYVSLTGVTGSSKVDLVQAAQRASGLAKEANVPVALGFGIKTAHDVASIAKTVDGVVVGSAIVDLAYQTFIHEGHSAVTPRIQNFVSELRQACQE